MSFVIPPHLLNHANYRKQATDAVWGANKAVLDLVPALDLSQFPLELAHSTKQGLHLIASRDISKGDVVLKESPTVATVRPESARLAQYCSYCFDSIDTARMEQWKEDNHDDSVLCAKCTEDYPRLVTLDKLWFRTWNQLRGERLEKPDDVDDFDFEHIDDGLWRLFTRTLFGWYGARKMDALSTDPDHLWILDSPKHLDTVSEHQIHLLIDGVLDSHARIVHDVDEISKLKTLLRIVFHNAHEVCDGDRSVGWAVYPIASLLNHSCDANATWAAECGAGVTEKGMFVCKAARDIKQGEEVCIAYARFPGVSARELYIKQSYMLKTWKFACNCKDCRRCWYCGSKDNLQQCGNCRIALYCSKSCQEHDFKTGDAPHKVWCLRLMNEQK